MPLGEEVVNDYRFLRLSLRAHPAQFLRTISTRTAFFATRRCAASPRGAQVKISGLVTCRQRLSSANGVVFMTLEDESARRQCDRVAENIRTRAPGSR